MIEDHDVNRRHRAPDRTARLAVCLSGGGRTLQNLIDCAREGRLPAVIDCVISSKPDVPGLCRADRAGIDRFVVSRRSLPDPDFHDEITAILTRRRIDLVCLAGFTTLYRIPDRFARRVINIHPALLPDFGGKGFYGLSVHRAVLQSNRSESGCTVHFCDNQYDHGPIILQRRVPVLPGDTPESLADRVFEQERIAYPQAIRRVIRDLFGS